MTTPVSWTACLAPLGKATIDFRTLSPAGPWTLRGTAPLRDLNLKVVGEVLHLRQENNELIASGVVYDSDIAQLMFDGELWPAVDLVAKIDDDWVFGFGEIAAVTLSLSPAWPDDVWFRPVGSPA